MKHTLIIPAISIAIASTLLGACASKPTTDPMDAVNEQMTELKSSNSSAMSMAEEALATAKSAKSDAEAAKADAASAVSTANAAKAQSDATDAKIDQMFKKAMYK